MVGKTIVLGFYNRGNIGDECYKLALGRGLGGAEYICMDDIDVIPFGVDTVVVGGGDVINRYFMEKARWLLAGFAGRVYAVSVGIPYHTADAGMYLRMFDHVFVRNGEDYGFAVEKVGVGNVDIMEDAAWWISHDASWCRKINEVQDVAVCLAQPAFNRNPGGACVLEGICRGLAGALGGARVHIVSFNVNMGNAGECDIPFGERLADGLREAGVPEEDVVVVGARGVLDTLRYISKMDMVVGMRYHSLVFAMLCGVPCLALYCTPKVRKLVKEAGIPGVEMSVDGFGRPRCVDSAALAEEVRRGGGVGTGRRGGFARVAEVVGARKGKVLREEVVSRDIDAVLEECIGIWNKWKDIDTDKREGVARAICYIITGCVDHPCVWGLASNMAAGGDGFDIAGAVRYIWDVYKGECGRQGVSVDIDVSRGRRVLVEVDRYQRYISSYHRSGWAYVIDGLLHLDARLLGRRANLFVDTYVDRTFHWAREALREGGAIPYRRPWVGFVHHTFDETHSTYNCVGLMKNNDFTESLGECRGLVALSDHLGRRLRKALEEMGWGNIPVCVIYHPTEFVGVETFTMEKFMANPQRAVVQVGAWLRDPYALYMMRVGPLVRKVALRGKDMHMYFPPEGYMEMVRRGLGVGGGDGAAGRGISRPKGHTNRFCEGAARRLEEDYGSVEVIDRLDNAGYDRLLAENVVFLRLVDCSAANTVIECIVRNTPLIVNRLPALEEVLGLSYPGFYHSLEEAQDICSSQERLARIHEYMTWLDKERYRLDSFVDAFQRMVLGEPQRRWPLFSRTPGAQRRWLAGRYGIGRYITHWA